MAKTKGGIDFGAKEFPAGTWDDFDARIGFLEFQQGEFNTQLFGVLYPAEYEYLARGYEYDESEEYDEDVQGQNFPRQWWSLGGGEYDVSEDGYSVDGPQMTSRARCAKLMLAMREVPKAPKLNSGGVKPLLDFECHWKIVHESNRDPNDRTKTIESDILYPAGKTVGKPSIGGGTSSKGKKGDDEDEEEETPRKSRSRRAMKEEPEEEPEGEGESGDLQEKAIEAIVETVTKAGSKGVSRRKLGTELMKQQDELGEEVVTKAAKRSTIAAAVESGKVEEEDGKLFTEGGEDE